MRKAYLGFLLAARLHAQGNKNWRMNRAGEDLFMSAEKWKLEFSSGEEKKNAARSGRNPNPIHDVPSSQEDD